MAEIKVRKWRWLKEFHEAPHILMEEHNALVEAYEILRTGVQEIVRRLEDEYELPYARMYLRNALGGKPLNYLGDPDA